MKFYEAIGNCVGLKSKTLRNCLSSSFPHHFSGIIGNLEQKNVLQIARQLIQLGNLLL